MYPDRKKFVLEPFMLVPVFSGKKYTKKVLDIAPASLIGYWPMGEASGATADNAEGTAARDGSYVGVTLGQPGIGDGNTSPLFDGTNDYNAIGTASLGTAMTTDNLTIACWAKVSGLGVWTDGSIRYPIRLFFGTTDFVQVLKSATNNRLSYQCEWGDGGLLSRDKNSVTTTDWFHVAITLNVLSDAAICYYNGIQEGATLTGLVTQLDAVFDTSRTIVGASITTPSQVWDGYIAHAAMWNTDLTAAQILELATV